MNIFKLLGLASLCISACFSMAAFAGFQKMADCNGVSQSGLQTRMVLFVDVQNDVEGLITVSINDRNDYASVTAVDWNSNPNGYPRFWNNDFDLDIVINDQTSSTDDILVGNEYVSHMECRYSPN